MAPSTSAGVFTDFYTGGGKRTPSNIDARNFLADAFLKRNASIPPVTFAQQGMATLPASLLGGHEMNDGYSRGDHGYHRRSRNRRYFSDSSDYSTPEKKKKKRRYRKEDNNEDGDVKEKNEKSIVNIN